MVLLPQELIIEILLRLPVKSLVRFKSVCKLWLSLISDPHFAISHFELAMARTERLVFLAPLAREFLTIDFNASLHDDSASAVLKCFTEPFDYLEIIGSCRGFLLLDLRCALCMWNPSTGVHKFVNWSPFVSSNIMGLDVGDEFSVSIRGFGYDPSTDDYLVVLLASSNNDVRITRMQYFSLRANAWREIEATHLSCSICIIDNQVGLFLNGAIHWLAFGYDISMDGIVAFDLTERSFSDIPLPVDFDLDNFQFWDLRVLGELLNLFVGGYNWVEIWAMKEYKVQSSWTRTIVVSVDDFPTQFFYLICSTKGGDIVGTDGSTGLIKCNDKGELQEHRSYGEYQFQVYTQSLLSLPCDSERAEKVDI